MSCSGRACPPVSARTRRIVSITTPSWPRWAGWLSYANPRSGSGRAASSRSISAKPPPIWAASSTGTAPTTPRTTTTYTARFSGTRQRRSASWPTTTSSDDPSVPGDPSVPVSLAGEVRLPLLHEGLRALAGVLRTQDHLDRRVLGRESLGDRAPGALEHDLLNLAHRQRAVLGHALSQRAGGRLDFFVGDDPVDQPP